MKPKHKISEEGSQAKKNRLDKGPPEKNQAKSRQKPKAGKLKTRISNQLRRSKRKAEEKKAAEKTAKERFFSGAEAADRKDLGQRGLGASGAKEKAFGSKDSRGAPFFGKPPEKSPQNSLEEKLKKAQNDYLYLKADFENFKRQALKDRRELSLYGGQELIRSLADEALDDLDRSLQAAEGEISPEDFKSGIELIHKKIKQTLRRFGVSVIDPSGTPFDPESQEAMGREKTSKVPEDHVSAVLKKAYKLHDKVIRPALVIVAKKNGKSES